MRILVTGASGFAGRHLIAALARTGAHEITAGALDRPEPMDEASTAARWIDLDVTSEESTRAAIGASCPDRVYHLAGQASVGDSFRDPLRTWDVNATGVLRVLEALRLEGASSTRVLLTSSAEVYGAVPGEEQPIREDRDLRPITPYGASKAAAEMLAVQSTLGGTSEVVIARSFNHIGPGQDARFVLPSFARQLAAIRAGESSPVLGVGNLDVDRDFLDVRDAVRGYIAMMEDGDAGGAYNVCSSTTRSLGDVVNRLVEISGLSVEVVVDPERVRPVDIPRLTGASDRLRSLGWAPGIPLDQTLADLLAEAYGRAGVRG